MSGCVLISLLFPFDTYLLLPSTQKYNRELKTLLDNKRDDAVPVAEIGEKKAEQNGKSSVDGGGGGGKKRLELEEITRFTMVKRIW